MRPGRSFTWSRWGGAFEHFDYVTGQTRKGVNAFVPRFWFSCDYYRQPRGVGGANHHGGLRGADEVGERFEGGGQHDMFGPQPATGTSAQQDERRPEPFAPQTEAVLHQVIDERVVAVEFLAKHLFDLSHFRLDGGI